MDRHPSITRTRITRDCPHCEGTGEVIVNDTNPHGHGPDPQRDEPVACDHCDEGVLVEWRDPLIELAQQRRGVLTYRTRHWYAPFLHCAMRPVLGQLRMIEAAIRMDLACRSAVSAWRAAA